MAIMAMMGASWDPVPQFRLLAGLQATACALTLPFALFKLDPNSWHEAEVFLAFLWFVLACFTWWVAPRISWWALDASLAGSSLLLAYSAVITIHPQVQIIDGITMMLFGVFSAYTLSLRRVASFLAFSVTVYVVSLMLTPLLGGFWVGGLVVAMMIFNTFHVWFLVHRLREAALIDPLTGVLNRNGLSVKAPAVRAVAQRAGNPTTVVLIDLDDFKQVNDRLGHAAGDKLLVGLVTAWGAELRPSDLLARVGGDEFVLVLPNCDTGQAQSMLERLEPVSGCRWTAGYAQWSAADPDVFTAMVVADHAMYRAKRPRGPAAGRGQSGLTGP